MKAVIFCASVLAYGLSPDAQITTVLNRVSPIHRGDVRLPEIEVRNDCSVSLAAFAVSMAPVPSGETSHGSFVMFFDMAVDQTVSAMLPGQTYKVSVPNRAAPGKPPEEIFTPPIISAGVYVDGSTTGDAALLRRLILRRYNMLQAVELTSEILSDAGAHNVPRGQLIALFQNLADSVQHWYLPFEQPVGYGLYRSMVEKLMELPQVQLGEPFPPTSFVQREMAVLQRQRTTLLESQPALNVADASATCCLLPRIR